jgi:TolB-like protein
MLANKDDIRKVKEVERVKQQQFVDEGKVRKDEKRIAVEE